MSSIGGHRTRQDGPLGLAAKAIWADVSTGGAHPLGEFLLRFLLAQKALKDYCLGIKVDNSVYKPVFKCIDVYTNVYK